jgi:hypothetical protein
VVDSYLRRASFRQKLATTIHQTQQQQLEEEEKNALSFTVKVESLFVLCSPG